MSGDKSKQKTAVNPDDYGYATGRIRALEASLMSQADLARLFEMRHQDDIIRLMQEKGYINAAIEEALKNKSIQTYEILQQIIPDDKLMEAILLFNDCHNLKVILKYLSTWWTNASGVEKTEDLPESDSALAHQGLKDLWREPALVEPVKLFRAVRDRKKDQLPEWLYELALSGAQCYLKTYDAGSVDILIDKAAWSKAMVLAEELGNDFFKGYLILKQNLLNLEILLRCRNLHTGKDYLKKALLPVPGILENDWLDAYDYDSDMLAAMTKQLEMNGKYSFKEIEKIIKEQGEGNISTIYNNAADMAIFDWIGRASLVLRGPEVPLAYLLRRELEIKNIRIAYTCLRNGISSAQARKLARASV